MEVWTRLELDPGKFSLNDGMDHADDGKQLQCHSRSVPDNLWRGYGTPWFVPTPRNLQPKDWRPLDTATGFVVILVACIVDGGYS